MSTLKDLLSKFNSQKTVALKSINSDLVATDYEVTSKRNLDLMTLMMEDVNLQSEIATKGVIDAAKIATFIPRFYVLLDNSEFEFIKSGGSEKKLASVAAAYTKIFSSVELIKIEEVKRVAKLVLNFMRTNQVSAQQMGTALSGYTLPRPVHMFVPKSSLADFWFPVELMMTNINVRACPARVGRNLYSPGSQTKVISETVQSGIPILASVLLSLWLGMQQAGQENNRRKIFSSVQKYYGPCQVQGITKEQITTFFAGLYVKEEYDVANQEMFQSTFTKISVNNKAAQGTPDYKRESEFYETLDSLCKSANKRIEKEVLKQSVFYFNMNGGVSVRPVLDDDWETFLAMRCRNEELKTADAQPTQVRAATFSIHSTDQGNTYYDVSQEKELTNSRKAYMDFKGKVSAKILEMKAAADKAGKKKDKKKVETGSSETSTSSDETTESDE